MMTIQHRYSFLFKRWGIVIICLFAGFFSVLAGPFIVTQPVSQRICESDGGVQFTLTVNGDITDYLLRWHRWWNSEWIPMEGPPGSGPDYTPSSAGRYMCIVILKATQEQEQSDEVTLTIDEAPSITDITAPMVCNEENLVAAAVGVNHNGSNLDTYEWILNDVSQGVHSTTTNTVPDMIVTNAAPNNYSIRIAVENACGRTIFPVITLPAIWTTVNPTPQPPKPVVKDYCLGETAAPLSIESGNEAVWYHSATGGSPIPTPVPNTSTDHVETWWVLQKVPIPDGSNRTCESGRSMATVETFAVPDPPTGDTNYPMCVDDSGITLPTPAGNNIKWYNETKTPLSTAPQINTSTVGTQTYYVTQDNGNCVSPVDDGKITVVIRDRANADNITLSYNPELCPNSSTIIYAAAQVTPPVLFKWYAYSDKTMHIIDGDILETPVLSKDTAFYVSIVYGGLCESSYAQAAVINVRDIILPKITAPPNVVVTTNDGVCYASDVQAGIPLVSDNCTPADKLIVISDPVIDLTTHYELGDTTLLWRVWDEAGNTDYALQNVSVRDREKPRPKQPVQDIIKEIDEYETSVIVYYDWEYEDNCTPANELIDSLYTTKYYSGAEFPLGEHQVIRYIIDKAGNVDTCLFKVIVRHPYREMIVDRMRVTPSFEVCPGQEVVITPIVSGGSGKITYSWNPRSWTDAVMRDYPTKNTTYEVIVSDGITTISKSIPITVLETRQVKLTLEGRTPDEIFEGDEVLVTATSGYEAYKLLLNNEIMQEVGMNNSVSFQAELGTYVVRVFATDDNFCVTQDQMIIEVESKKLPNVFTPNFDGINDLFLEFLEKPNAPNDFELQVFNRAGQLLYKGNKGWDGTYKGKILPQSTYLYVVRRRMNNGEFRTFTGYVTIKL